jgi:hypothetical protein
VEINKGAIIKFNYELCVKVVNKCNIQSKTPSIVTRTYNNISVKGKSKEVQHTLTVWNEYQATRFNFHEKTDALK